VSRDLDTSSPYSIRKRKARREKRPGQESRTADGFNPDTDVLASRASGFTTDADGLKTDADGLDPDADVLVSRASGLTTDVDGLKTDADRLNPDADVLASRASGFTTDADGLTTDADGLHPDADVLASQASGLMTDAVGLTTDADDLVSVIEQQAREAREASGLQTPTANTPSRRSPDAPSRSGWRRGRPGPRRSPTATPDGCCATLRPRR